MTKKLLLYASVLCTIVFSSCKDDEEEIQKIKEVRYGEFVMDNEYGPRMLLNLKEMKIVPLDKIEDEDSLEKVASESDFDIAFAYFDPESIFEDEEDE